MAFITENFLLDSETGRRLYHEYAAPMEIFDYHSHLPPEDIARDRTFDNLSEIWLAADHYKWRAMRAAGVGERYITGAASDYEKFQAWAETLPKVVRNPLYHWSYLELDRYFGLKDALLGGKSARFIYDRASALLKTKEFSVRNLLRRMKVKVLCTTDDPADDLCHHRKIKEDGFEIKVYPAFRPDRALGIESPKSFNAWVERLEAAADLAIGDFDAFIAAIESRHDFFHQAGCRISDHGLLFPSNDDFTLGEIRNIFAKVRGGKTPDGTEAGKFKTAMMTELARLNRERGWVMQLHLGALRSVNTRMAKLLGPDTGYDAIGDFELARPLAGFLDRLSLADALPRMILYSINSKDNEVLTTIAGSFQDGPEAGKIQFGPAWWFLDQKDGMTAQLDCLSNIGLLSGFVGMTTDSRSFLSYPRHEYFRRILCNLIGSEADGGEIFEDPADLGRMIEDICYGNALKYFGLEL